VCRPLGTLFLRIGLCDGVWWGGELPLGRTGPEGKFNKPETVNGPGRLYVATDRWKAGCFVAGLHKTTLPHFR